MRRVREQIYKGSLDEQVQMPIETPLQLWEITLRLYLKLSLPSSGYLQRRLHPIPQYGPMVHSRYQDLPSLMPLDYPSHSSVLTGQAQEK